MDTQTARFRVAGKPQTQGSKKAFMRPGMKFPVVVDTNKATLRTWRSDVRDAALAEWHGGLMDGEVSLTLIFSMPRPKSHFGAKGLKPTAPVNCASKPDLDKLQRAVLDALTDVLWTDDSRVVRIEAVKRYGDPGLIVEVSHVGAIREREGNPF